MDALVFTPAMLQRPTAAGIDAVTTLRHFAIVTYAVPAARLRPVVDARFDLDCIDVDGDPHGLLSVVPFEDQDFRGAALRSPRGRFGQTNYRIYIRERGTGARAVWFLGTTLGSWLVCVPRFLWRLPWYHGRFAMTCEQDGSGRYTAYRMVTRSRWAPAELELVHEPDAALVLPGFPDLETGLVVLTHPLTGYYHRRDGRLGSYAIWHDRLTPTMGRVKTARFGLLDRLGLVSFAEQGTPHSVLMQAETEFLVRLPPRAV